MKFKNVLFMLSAIMLLSACSKLTKDNYQQLEVGMSEGEVKAILGSADNCSQNIGTLTCVWGDEESKHIKVRFIADAAITFSNNGL
ncbi:hypothetical protein [Thalassotalea sp. ND16A]|uniref:hypothetical protein n=1 Tax=Thalassotalea sp. ND16A TaxID=1535422 RepID=UPI00051DABBE|nr:hypothetical protein [Thalassotalea sp. ND16A]KGK00643.1 hypothetical protein ND16A_3403 [Thalassotalea sp. ND16A]